MPKQLVSFRKNSYKQLLLKHYYYDSVTLHIVPVVGFGPTPVHATTGAYMSLDHIY